jgi:dipeptidyl aminopeptidase/acylaminoacyl peptidase
MFGKASSYSVFIAIVLGATETYAAVEPPAPVQRGLHLDDIFALEHLGRASFASDGRQVAFVRARSLQTLNDYSWQGMNDEGSSSDIWLQPNAKSKAVNLTKGITDGSGWFSPKWSPDGVRLAMLSTRGDTVGLWVWDGKTGRMRRLTTRALEPRPFAFAWVDPRRVVCMVLPDGEEPYMLHGDRDTPRLAAAGWAKMAKGKESTASVLSSAPRDLSQRLPSEILLIDVTSGAVRVLGDGNASVFDGWQLAPNGYALAYLVKQRGSTPQALEKLRFASGSESFSLEVRDLKGVQLLSREQALSDVVPRSVRWSPDGRELAFLGFEGTRNKPPKLYRLHVLDGGLLEPIDLNGQDALPLEQGGARLQWTTTGDIVVRARKPAAAGIAAGTVREDWWLVSRDGAIRCLTTSMVRVPERLVPLPDGRTFIGVSQGKVWRIGLNRESAQALTETSGSTVENIVWPPDPTLTQNPEPEGAYQRIVLSTQSTREPLGYSVLDLRSMSLTPLIKSSVEAELRDYSPASGEVVFSASGRTGDYLWRYSFASGQADEIAATNAFLREIVEGQFKSIEYRSLNGEMLKAWMILPTDYQVGKRYPLLTWVYSEAVADDLPPDSQRIGEANPLNMQIPASHGYAVLLPSMPLTPNNEPDDVLLKLTDGVLPAVDEAIAAGIADPDRVFVMGHSLGGFSTYGLITQTHRFKAAVALAGFSDWVSYYGLINGRNRYGDRASEDLFAMRYTESGQARLGSPPWKDLGRYLRNSPITYVDRVQTPILIVQGDLDYVPIEQGEEFFMSLLRQGKRAEFVRYWGEDHVLNSPANIRDMWARVFSWLDEFGDISRDVSGNLVFDGNRVKSRDGVPPLKPQDFAKFDRKPEKRNRN